MASRRKNRVACLAELDAEFGARTFEECKDLLSGLDAPWAPVQAVEELLDDPQVVANGYIGTVSEDGLEYRLPTVPVQFDEQPPPMRRAPEHGEHTETVLLELGYSWEDISALQDAGALP
jgi:crotonobetainyl-CoA:carnitine CoA-transferase CaiB-like acyl-CoA transferase